jgi:undecaprenyl-phosphate 4-deoxy-4-formamido-L-arabinose transferase
MEGALARSACAYIGESVYLDVAMRWTCGQAAFCSVPMRSEGEPSSYTFRRLLSHFWRMVLSNGVRPLRIVAGGGLLVAVIGVLFAALTAVRRVRGDIDVEGWSSVMVVLLVLMGGLFVSVATLAEYVGFAVRNAIGKPLYVQADPPASRALWQLQSALQSPGAAAA